ncbi:7-cyano-7-deazaguanine reductase [Hyphomicrobium nitrativorans NL23]|uniref:7-carboxy-7-deazaguanine synthase n=1 Tax=Hyphomicrobium nitrativorans NL23 TaxID=1029756 RepID=V5SFI5_9HYPH|nr:7-carboxy-7-deazaguanine synthase [Hyphomicrobium nitrativorans]AHB48790.1 7-cyano-7-deazaguanine reductase [Hyphomicrobium nitrativorans NL23]
MYAVKEIFYTLQGEGANAGRAAVFCRFAGCNLWSGREKDRLSAACDFCDTDFVGTDGEGGGKYAHAHLLVEAVAAAWQGGDAERFVVLTGGEPALQVDDALIDGLHRQGFVIAVETNGTLPLPAGIDWICVSPKAGNDLAQTSGDELKLVYPQEGLVPESLLGLDFPRRYLSPMDGPRLAENTAAAVAYVKAHPIWRLSVQTHKRIGIP